MTKRPIEAYIDELFAEAVRRCPTTADAEDAVQETMLAALTHLERGGSIEDPSAWLHSVLSRKYYDILRRKYRLPTVTMDEAPEFSDTDEAERDEDTDFIIYDADDSVRYRKEQEQFAAEHATPYCEAAQRAIEALKKTDFYSLRLERYMLIKIASASLWRSMEPHRAPQIFPDRPNGGKWIAFGMIDRKHRDPMLYTGCENYNLSGERCEKLDNYLDAKGLALYNYESALYPYPKLVIEGFSTFMEAEASALKLFYLIEKGIAPETVDADPRVLRAIPQLEREGFLTMKDGHPHLLIPRLTHAQWKQYRTIIDRAAGETAAVLEAPMIAYTRTHRKNIPAHLKSVPEQKLTMPYEPSAMMFVFEAIRRGIHPRDLGYPCPETVAVFD